MRNLDEEDVRQVHAKRPESSRVGFLFPSSVAIEPACVPEKGKGVGTGGTMSDKRQDDHACSECQSGTIFFPGRLGYPILVCYTLFVLVDSQL